MSSIAKTKDTPSPGYSNDGNTQRTQITEKKYDFNTDSWTDVVSSFSTSENDSSQSDDSNSNSGSSSSADSGDNGKSKIKADKEFIEMEMNTLTGEVTLIPNTKTIRFNEGDTLLLEGLGKFLSGQYYVSAVKRKLDSSNGYSQTITVVRNGFGPSLKSPPPETDRPQEIPIIAGSVFNVGEKIQIIGEDAVYSNAHEGVKIPEWVKQKTDLVITQVSSDGSRVLLQPINSWTYTKFIVKV